MEILYRDKLPLGGFAGIKEHRLVIDQRIGGDVNTWDGIGNFVYLADARYNPYGESNMHSHSEIDIISVILEGAVNHEGSLKHGQSLATNQVQVQRAGGEGFSHNEINPDGIKNRMLQIWVLPEEAGEPANYKVYTLKKRQMTHIYGGGNGQDETLPSNTNIEVGILSKDQKIKKEGEFLAYITDGKAYLNDIVVEDGMLIHGTGLDIKAIEDNVRLTIISTQ